MTDTLTRKQRSYNMSRIRSSKTRPELNLRGLLEPLGFEYQPKDIFGRPDFVNREKKTAVFVDGCFWHKCPEHFVQPATRAGFWMKKIEGNVRRDAAVNKKLSEDGWKVIRVWEHDAGKGRKSTVLTMVRQAVSG